MVSGAVPQRGQVGGEGILAASLRGPVLEPGDAGYDEARAIWNGMIDRRPGLIAQCVDADDVVAALRFATSHDLPLAVRGGDHSAAGNAMCDGGVVIDLSPMKDVVVDADGRTARAGAGLRWGEFDRATQRHGLATTGGTVADTGIAGLTLGGGIGWLAGRYGLSCDNLIEAEVVTADGQVVTASQDQHPDLFWALRGGSGNFGVVTSFTFRLHPVGPTVAAGMVAHPVERAGEVLRFYREVVEELPDEVNTVAGFLTTPDGVPVVVLAACHCGDVDEGLRVLEPLRQFGPPVVDQIGPVSYCDLQTSLDPVFPRGRRYYWKSTMVKTLADDAVDRLVELFATIRSPFTAVLLQQLGRAVNRIPPSATAFPHRDARWDGLLLSGWEDPAEDTAHIDWTRRAWDALRPFSTGGVYVNGVADGDPEELSRAYGANHTRLAAIKATYDPTNAFRLNANIEPVVPPAPLEVPAPT